DVIRDRNVTGVQTCALPICINRGRVEQGINEFATYVDEMGNTVARLYEQLRRLDVETEAQILSNYQQGVEQGKHQEDGFDPLEKIGRASCRERVEVVEGEGG